MNFKLFIPKPLLFLRFILLIAQCVFVCELSYGQADEQNMDEWTKQSEQYLTNNYSVIRSSWFEKSCMEIAQIMQFKKINQCRLLDSQYVNAYVLNNGHVYFSLALIKEIRNHHQWAAILAHENAHIELNHYVKNHNKMKNPGVFFPKAAIKRTMRKHEIEADQWSNDKLEFFGYDVGQINYFLKRVKKLKKNKKQNTHLKLSKRIKKSESKEIIDIALMEKIAAINVNN